VRWLAAGLLRVGRVWLGGDDGTLAGGRRLRLQLADRLRRPDPAHGEMEVTSRDHTYPDLPPQCRRRLQHLSTEGLRLRSSGRRTFLVSIVRAPADDAGVEPLIALVAHARSVGHSCLTVMSGPGDTERLRSAGFAPGRELPPGPDGRPPMTAWKTPL
jgi:hypothetical protein